MNDSAEPKVNIFLQIQKEALQTRIAELPTLSTYQIQKRLKRCEDRVMRILLAEQDLFTPDDAKISIEWIDRYRAELARREERTS